jgi:lipoprotein-anchoring transpeptidase ErfK/SrfK
MRSSKGSGSLLVVIAVAAIATGGAAVALGIAGATSSGSRSTSSATPSHRAAVNASGAHHRNVVLVTIPPAPAPVVIPAAPSTTADPTLGAAQSGGVSPTLWRSHVRSAVPGLVNSAPTAVNDPSVVATANVPNLPLFSAPGAAQPSSSLRNPNYLGAQLVLLVTGYQPGWVQAYVPVRPNESTAWIPAADVTISFVSDHIVVSLSARKLTLYHDNAPVFSTPVAPGAPSSPTPTGSFFVAYIVKLTDPGNVYGPYAMGTSAFSNTYYSFEGGPGQVGIHGTNQPWVIGSYASHGCVRLPNNAITTVAEQIVPGTPVEIEP